MNHKQCQTAFYYTTTFPIGSYKLSAFAKLTFAKVHFTFSFTRVKSEKTKHLRKMYALSKLNKQNEQTWVNLQKRLNEVQFSYKKLFPEPVHNFINNKAVSVGSCEGYFVPSLLTTTAYLLACNHARVQTLTHDQPLNIYTIFVGYPGTGKHSIFKVKV